MSSIPSNTQTIQIPERYAKYGIRTGFMPLRAERLRYVIEGTSGEGKSTLIASDQETLLLDFDRASCNVYGRRCFTAYDAQGGIMTWAEYAALKAAMIEDKKKGACPFNRVAFDTLDAFIDLLDAHIVEERQEKAKSDAATIHNVTSITEYGEQGSGYRILRSALMHEIKDWEAAGFAWSAAVQLKTKFEDMVNADGSKSARETKRSLMAPTAMDLLCMSCDVCLYVHSEQELEDVIVTAPGGRQVKTGQRKVTRYYADVSQDSPILRDAKRRILGFSKSIVLPATDGWATFCKSYNDVVASLQATPSPTISPK